MVVYTQCPQNTAGKFYYKNQWFSTKQALPGMGDIYENY